MHRKLHSLVLALCAAATGVAETASPGGLNLIPWPAQLTQIAGQFALTEGTTIVADTAFTNEAAQLATALALPTGENGAGITPSSSAAGKIC